MNPDVLKTFDQATRDTILKAAEVLATQTFSPSTRSVFAPENIEEDIKLLVPKDTPIRNRTPRVQGFGQAGVFKKLTSKLHSNTGAAGVGTNTSVAFADAAAPNATSQTYSTVAFPFKLLGRSVEVGGMAIAATRNQLGNNPVTGGQNMLDSRQRTKAVEVMLGEEELLIGGDSAVDSNQFDGLGKQLTTNSGNAALLTASGIGTFCNTVYNAGGDPTVIYANARQNVAIANNLEWSGSIQRAMISNTGSVTVGYKVSNVINPVTGTVIDLEVSRYTGGDAYLLTEKDPAGNNWVQVEQLIPMSVVDIQPSTFSTLRFVLEAQVLEVIGEPFCMKVGGLAIG
ncbi:hypothetical protein KBC89_03505 [Candidatus Woesebacteria bacterium]|nr:hypothetical protein [Candidatus Woesebacteria bacterium]